MPKLDPHYEKRELARLKALMADPRYWKTMEPDFVATVRQGFEALYDTPPPRALAREGEAANELGLNGPRHGRDKDLAHVTPGEIVVPLSAQTPEVLNALYAVMGDRMAHFVVGGGHEQRNPTSGLPAFAGGSNWFKPKRWHFEQRDEMNRPLPSSPELARKEGFRERPWGKSLFHQKYFVTNGNHVFVHPDGREVVYKRETGELVRDPSNMGTFNYVNSAPMPDNFTDIVGWAKWAGSNFDHLIRDIKPYAMFGNTRGRYKATLEAMQNGFEPDAP